MFSGNHPNVWPEKYWNDTLQKNNMQPTNPNAHTYVNGKDVETHRVKTSENFLMNLTIFSWTSQFAISKSMLRAKIPSIL
jgi:hypothetical protein